jgi:hypothetical protein
MFGSVNKTTHTIHWTHAVASTMVTDALHGPKIKLWTCENVGNESTYD